MSAAPIGKSSDKPVSATKHESSDPVATIVSEAVQGTFAQAPLLIFSDVVALINEYIDGKEEHFTRLIDRERVTQTHLVYLDEKLLNRLLVVASERGHLELTKRLVEECFIPIAPKALLKAVQKNRLETVKFLFSKGASHSKELLQASQSDAMKLLLIKLGCPTRFIEEVLSEIEDEQLQAKLREREAFVEACEKGKLKKVEMLLAMEVFVDAEVEGQTGLFCAVKKGQAAVVQLLLQHQASVSEEALFSAIEDFSTQGRFQILQLLFARELKVEITVEEDGLPPEDEEEAARRYIAKILTTYLYVEARHSKNPEKVASIQSKRQKCIQKLAQEHFDEEEELLEDDPKNWLKNYEADQRDYFGSYPSSDSDSEEEQMVEVAELESGAFKKEVSKASQKMILWERDFYLRDSSKDDGDQIQAIVKRKRKEAQKFVETAHLQQFQKVFSVENPFEYFEKDKIFLKGTGGGLLSQTKIEGQSPQVDRAKIKPLSGKEENLFYADYRGYCYITRLWDKEARRAHRRAHEVDKDNPKPLRSMAVQFAASQVATFADLHAHRSGLTPAEEVTLEEKMGYYTSHLKKSLHTFSESNPYKLRLNTGTGFQNFSYDNLGELLQTVYTCNYKLYFELLESDFFRNALLVPESPYISTAETPYHALRYAYGLKTFKGHQDETLRPRWRADGKPERPYAGKVYLFLHPLKDLKEAHRIITMLFQGKCRVKHEIHPEREISYFAEIPGDRIVYQHVAKYPSFRKYKKIYEYKYGIDANLFKLFKNFLKKCRRENRLDCFTSLIGEYLCAFHEMRFVSIAERAAKEKKGTLVYLDELGQPSKEGFPVPHTSPFFRGAKPELDVSNPPQSEKERYETYAKLIQELKNQNELPEFPGEGGEIIAQIKKIEKSQTLLDYFIEHRVWRGVYTLVNFRLQEKRGEKLPDDRTLTTELTSKSERLTLFAKAIHQLKHPSFSKEIGKIKPEILELETKHTTLLHYFIIRGDAKSALHFLKYVIVPSQRHLQIVNLRDKYGNTPLHLATLLGHADLIQLLKDKGADSSIINDEGKTAEQVRPFKLPVAQETKPDEMRAPFLFDLSGTDEKAEKVVISEIEALKITGLKNQRNDCFFNASMQLIFRHEELWKFFLAESTFTPFFIHLVKRYAARKVSYDRDTMRALLNFYGDGQQDAAETLTRMIGFYATLPVFHTWKKVIRVNPSQMVKIEGEPKKHSALNFDYQLIERQNQLFWQLEINGTSLQEWINHYFVQKLIKDKFRFAYEGSVHLVKEYQEQTDIEVVGPLFLQIKRFSKPGQKNGALLNLRAFTLTIKDKSYQIDSFIVHLGNSLQSGHYVTYSKTLKQQWTLFDDETIKDQTDDEALRALQEAYILYLKPILK